MTITFENENDIIVYALEKIISYARDNHYIFIAQSVWWIASVIGLSEGLATHIDNLRIRFEANLIVAEEDKISKEKDSTIISSKRPNTAIQENHIHPDRISQIGNKDSDDNEVDNSELESDRATFIIQSARRFVNKSRKERQAYKQKPHVLSRTRSGKVPAKPLTKKQRNRLRAIPKDTLSIYLAGQK